MVPPAPGGRPPTSRSPTQSPSPNQSTSAGTRTTAPLGIKIFCVIAALVAVYGLFLSVRIMAAGGPFTTLGFLFLLLFVGYAVVLYGLWTVKSWGWTWGMILFALDALLDLVALQFVGLLVSLVLLAYLYSKRSVYR